MPQTSVDACSVVFTDGVITNGDLLLLEAVLICMCSSYTPQRTATPVVNLGRSHKVNFSLSPNWKCDHNAYFEVLEIKFLYPSSMLSYLSKFVVF